MKIELSDPKLERRAALHAALGDSLRLAIVDELALSDRSPAELATGLGISSSLLAHHLELLIAAGVVARTASDGDRRRRYMQLLPEAFEGLLRLPARRLHASRVVFVCTANSARSQFAQALWSEQRPDIPATSGGTEPADRVNPQTVRAAKRAGLSLGDAVPRPVPPLDGGDLVVTVCDRAYEATGAEPDLAIQRHEPRRHTSLHWAVPDPVRDGDFDAALARVRRRVDALARRVAAVDRSEESHQPHPRGNR